MTAGFRQSQRLLHDTGVLPSHLCDYTALSKLQLAGYGLDDWGSTSCKGITVPLHKHNYVYVHSLSLSDSSPPNPDDLRSIDTLINLWRTQKLWIFFFSGAAAQRGPGPPHSWGFWITHSDAPQTVGLLWTRDRPVAETSTWQHTTLTRFTNIHAPGGIRTRNPCRRPRLRALGHWDWQKLWIAFLQYAVTA